MVKTVVVFTTGLYEPAVIAFIKFGSIDDIAS